MKRTLLAALALMVTAGIAVAQPEGFPDVRDDHPAADAIAEAVAAEWFEGYKDGTFRPDNRVTNSQIAVVFRRAFPDDPTRAELAQVLSAGRQALEPATTTTTTTSAVDEPDVPGHEYPDKPVIRIRNRSWANSCQNPDFRISETNLRYDDPEQVEDELRNIEAHCRDTMFMLWDAELVYAPADMGTIAIYYRAGFGPDKIWFDEDNGLLQAEAGRSSYTLPVYTDLVMFMYAIDERNNRVPVIYVCERWADFVDEGDVPVPPELC